MATEQKCQTLSITVIALNEEANIARCLKSAQFAKEIILVDSGSKDRTLEIARQYGAKTVQADWKGFGAQKNIAASHAEGPWILNIDADEEITPELKQEILEKISSHSPASGYAVGRKTFYLGKWIKHGGWYPNYVTRLARKDTSSWSEPNVHEELLIKGVTQKLKNPLNHYTFQNIEDQIKTNLRYAREGSLDLVSKGKSPSILMLLIKPIGKFFETYFFKLGFLDGVAGFIISINAAYSMFMKWAFLYEHHLRKKK